MKLFVVDLDDTLLSEGAIPSDANQIWQQLMQSGAPVTVATARGLHAAMAPLGDAIPQLPMVVLNGAVIATCDQQYIKIQHIPIGVVDPICRRADQLGAIPCLLVTDGRNDSIFVPGRTDAFTEWTLNEAGYFKSHSIVRGGIPTLDCRTKVVRVILCATSDTAKLLHKSIASEFSDLATLIIPSRDQPGWAWLEVGTTNATKAHAISHVASLLRISLQDVVYYGDAAADLGPMAIVGESVAVANAQDDVLATADRIIGPAASGAVAFDLLQSWNLCGNAKIAHASKSKGQKH